MFDFSWLPAPLAELLPRILHAIKSRLKLDFLTVGLPALVLILGTIGYWKIDADSVPHSDAGGMVHVVTAIVFDVLGSFKTSFKVKDPHNLFTDLAALFGVLFLYSWFVVLLVTIFRETAEKAWARIVSRNHVVLIGDTAFADRAEKVWRQKRKRPLRIVSRDATRPHDWASRRVRAGFDEKLVRAFSLDRARHVLIDLSDDMQTLTLAFKLLSVAVERSSNRNTEAEWIIVVRNAALADHFAIKSRELRPSDANAAPLPDLHYLHPERLAARYFMAGHPLFLLARSRGQERVHALVVGNGSISRHLVELTFLASITADLARPAVTVLTAHPDAERRAFFSGRPALAEVVDIDFIDAEALDAFERHDAGAAEIFDKREARMPFTAAFLASDDSNENIRGALVLHRIQRKMSRLRCPIFSYQKDADEAEFLTASQTFIKAIGGFETFGLPDDFLTQQICDGQKRDLLARALHERYRQRSERPVAPWNELTESLRRANRNAADHWRAKMHMLGFVVDEIEAGTVATLRQEDAAEIERQPTLAAADGSVSPLASAVRCEHDRWMIERHLDGWAAGPERDDDRQIHNMLVSWEVLERDFPGEIAKDADQVEATIECLVCNGDPNLVLKRRAADTAMPNVAA